MEGLVLECPFADKRGPGDVRAIPVGLGSIGGKQHWGRVLSRKGQEKGEQEEGREHERSLGKTDAVRLRLAWARKYRYVFQICGPLIAAHAGTSGSLNPW